MKKLASIILLAFGINLSLFSQSKKNAEELRNDSLKQESVLDTIEYLKSNISLATTAADKRAILYFTATLQEQLGLYTDASKS